MRRIRVLFVDDEPNVLDGLRRSLRKLRGEWDAVFVSSGAEALAQLAAAPFDAVVTDVLMPGMSGAELLEAVMSKHPAVARIVLSGHTGEAHATGVLKVAHQFLSKPTDVESLREAVTRACASGQSTPSRRMRAIVASVGALPSPPELYLEITNITASDETSTAEVAAVIAQDPAVSAKLLQLVNSSFFGLGRRVSSIEQAVFLLGLIRVKSLILSANIIEQFVPTGLVPGFSIRRFWRRSVLTAKSARVISSAEHQAGDRPDQAFAGGLLHDLGLLILAARQGVGLAAALDRAQRGQVRLCEAERELLGVTHPEVGAGLLELWGLPPRLVEGVTLHHQPGETDFAGVCAVTAVHAAAALLPEVDAVGGAGEATTVYAPTLDVEYLARIGLLDRVPAWRARIAAELQATESAAASGPARSAAE